VNLPEAKLKKSYAIVLLAAGSSTRMGFPKQLLTYDGKPLIRHSIEVALRTSCDAVVVVLGANAAQIRTALEGIETGDKQVVVTENFRWPEGMGTSIRAGIEAVERLGVEDAILALADQPLITPEILNRLAGEHVRTGQPIVASQYAGTVGVPVFFAGSHFPQLAALAPDQGCKGVILKNRDGAMRIDCPEAEVDIDTPADYEAIQAAGSMAR
jgi:molybdenum cofactor cytidylyltransferase